MPAAEPASEAILHTQLGGSAGVGLGPAYRESKVRSTIED